MSIRSWLWEPFAREVMAAPPRSEHSRDSDDDVSEGDFEVQVLVRGEEALGTESGVEVSETVAESDAGTHLTRDSERQPAGGRRLRGLLRGFMGAPRG
jgi:hypothetical protein